MRGGHLAPATPLPPFLPLEHPFDVLPQVLHAQPRLLVDGARHPEHDSRRGGHVEEAPEQITDGPEAEPAPATAVAVRQTLPVLLPLVRHLAIAERPLHLFLDELGGHLGSHHVHLLRFEFELVDQRRAHGVGDHELDAGPRHLAPLRCRPTLRARAVEVVPIET